MSTKIIQSMIICDFCDLRSLLARATLEAFGWRVYISQVGGPVAHDACPGCFAKLSGHSRNAYRPWSSYSRSTQKGLLV